MLKAQHKTIDKGDKYCSSLNNQLRAVYTNLRTLYIYMCVETQKYSSWITSLNITFNNDQCEHRKRERERDKREMREREIRERERRV